MKTLHFSFLLFLLSHAPLFAQKNYFQQAVNYDIEVRLDDERHLLSGTATVEYQNNAPQSLDSIWFHLWMNAFQSKQSAFARQQLRNGDIEFYFAEKKDLGGYESLEFESEGKKLDWNFDPKNPDIAVVRLPKPLKTGEKIIFKIPFTEKIPSSFSRPGHVEQSYQITQWYPKPAVLDASGWHPMPYLDLGEFYSEFGNFDVRITLPSNYLVAATGVLQTESELNFRAEKEAATRKLLESGFETSNEFPASAPDFKTVRFTAENVHDFAWFADKRFHILKNEVSLPVGKKVDAYAFFTNAEAELWAKAPEYIGRALKFYSEHVGEYPYPQATAIQSTLSAGAGMEYPMITVIGKSGNGKALDRVITHEVGHNWFYGVLASNERDHAWMDEGVNSYYENRYMRQFYQNDAEYSVPRFFQRGSKISVEEWGYLFQARRNEDQPPAGASDAFTQINYALDVYSKTGRAFLLLEKYLGADLFDRCMKIYFEKWAFRHPQPGDLRAVLEKESGKNLGWLFDDLIGSNKKTDYAIESLRHKNDSLFVKIKNRGSTQTPLSIAAFSKEKLVENQWIEGFEGSRVITFKNADFDKIQLDEGHYTFDLHRKNDQIKTAGIFPKWEPLQLKLLGGIENPERSRINWLPAVGWNEYDKKMLGLALYSFPFPARNFEYALVPLFAFRRNELSGLAHAGYQIFLDSKIFHRLAFESDAKRFSYANHPVYDAESRYLKIAPKLTFDFQKSSPLSPVSQQLRLRSVFIFQKNVVGIDAAQGDFDYVKRDYNIHEAVYEIKNRQVLAPFTFSLTVQAGEGFSKFFAHHWQKVTYRQKGKALYLHAFAGWMDYQKPEARVDFLISGSTGSNQAQKDYLFDELLLGRNEREGVLSQQIFQRDANLKTLSNVGSSNTWMLGFGIRSGIPNPLPVEPYFDVAIYEKPFENKAAFTYSGGIALVIARDVFELYFPILESKDIREGAAYQSRKGYFQRVTFLLNINELNPKKLVEKIPF